MTAGGMVWRGIALGLGFLCLVGAALGLFAGQPGPAFGASIWGVLLIAGVAFERWRYKRTVVAAGPGFIATPERFIDTDTGRPVQVFVDPTSGERRYVEQ